MDDAVCVCVSEAVEHLRGRLDRLRVGELARAKCLPQGLSLYVLVRDVHVPGVAAEVVGANAPRMAQTGCSFGFAGRAGLSFPLAGDDLERDVESGPLVACQPDRAGGAATERPQWAITVEDQAELCGVSGRRHQPPPLRHRQKGSSEAVVGAGLSPGPGDPEGRPYSRPIP